MKIAKDLFGENVRIFRERETVCIFTKRRCTHRHYERVNIRRDYSSAKGTALSAKKEP